MAPTVDVLLVEDDAFDAEAAKRALALHDNVGEIHWAKSAEDALRLLAGDDEPALSVGMILLDLGLPKMSGLEFLNSIKDDFATAHLPVIVLSNNADPDELLEVYRRGAAAFLRKPDSVAGYRNMLQGVIRFWLLASWPTASA